MRQQPRKRIETFTVQRGELLRDVLPRRGDRYVHFCTLETFKEVVHAIDDYAGRGFVYEDIVSDIDLPNSQVATAIAFLKERGVIIPARRCQHKAAGIDAYLDGMLEWSANEHHRLEAMA